VTAPPTSLARAKAWIDQEFDRAHIEGASPSSLPATPAHPTIQHLIASWPDNWPLEDSHFLADPTALILATIQNETASGTCDGSYMPTVCTRVGTAAWKLEDPVSRQAMQGTTRTSGELSEDDSYCLELQGVHAIFLGLLAFCTFHQIPEGKATIGCENINSVKYACSDWLKVPLHTKHSDLIRAIQVLKDKLLHEVVFIHVYGHHDRHKFFHELDRPSHLDVEMDELAKTRLQEVLAQDWIPCCPSDIAHEGWQCHIINHK
jgi:hypothetical protein